MSVSPKFEIRQHRLEVVTRYLEVPTSTVLWRDNMAGGVQLRLGPVDVRGTDSDVPIESPHGHMHGRIVPYDTITQLDERVFEIVHRGSLTKTVQEHKNNVLLYSNHETRISQPIGRSRADGWDDRPDGQWAVFDLNGTTGAEDGRKLVASGDSDGFSMGFISERRELDYTKDDNGDEILIIHQREIRLHHVALVARPQYPDAYVAEVRELETPKLDHYREKYGIE